MSSLAPSPSGMKGTARPCSANISSSLPHMLSGYRFRRGPPRRNEPPLAVGREAHAGFAQCVSIPQLAGDLAVPLIERLAVIGVDAQAHFRAAASPNLREPVGIRERLARER